MANPSFDLIENPQMTNAQGTEVSNGLFDEGSGYGINSASNDSLGWFDNLLDPTGFVKGFYNDMMGLTSQEREFEQQMKMTQYENRWNSAQDQMNRAKEAGINPLTAAGGIAGNGNGSVAGAGGSATPSSAAADTISKLGLMNSQTDLSSAEAENQRSQAANNAAQLPWISKLNHSAFMNGAANFMKTITDAGNEEIAAGGIAFDILSGGLKAAVAYLSLYNGLRFKDNEFRNIKAQHDLTMKEVESFDKRIQSEMSLQAKQGLYFQQQALKAQSETTYQNSLNDIVKELPGIQLPGANGMIYTFFKYGPDSPQFKSFGEGLYQWNYKSSLGSFHADQDTAYQRLKNQVQGGKAGELVHAAAFAKLQNYQSLFNALCDLYFKSDGSLDGLAHRFVSLIGAEVGFSDDDLEELMKAAISSGNSNVDE